MAKKKTKSSSKGLNYHESNIKGVIAFLILLLAFGVLLIFNTYQENILASSYLQTFVGLTVFLFALLVALLFLINPQKHKR